jgi:hypothetical protein
MNKNCVLYIGISSCNITENGTYSFTIDAIHLHKVFIPWCFSASVLHIPNVS